MKNLSILLLSFCVLFFSGCKKEEDPTPSVSEQLIGKWMYESFEYDKYDENEQLVDSEFRELMNSVMEFRSDSVFDTFSTLPSRPNNGDDGTWELTDNDKTVVLSHYNGGSDIFNIEKLTTDKLIFTYNSEVIESGVTYKYNGRFSLTK